MRDDDARSRRGPGEPRRPRGVARLCALLLTAALGPLCAVAVGQGRAGSSGASTEPGHPGVTFQNVNSPYSVPTTTTPYSVPTRTTPPPVLRGGHGNPLATRGMWIWVMSETDHGNLRTITAQAKRYGIQTLMIKSSDGVQFWPQFNARTVATLHRAGLHVCAWQFVYGIAPAQEAQLGARAVHDGADCLLIDAESQYQGKYVQAQTYISTLRRLVGAKYPLGLAGFPYIDYHPSFPYSVFLGPGAAQSNVPQMYWLDIGTTVSAVYAHTYAYNLIYRRPIYPLGQLFQSPPPAQIRAFRGAALAYQAQGVSWWDWQSAGAAQLAAIAGRAAAPRGFAAATTYAGLARGAIGDVVVWAQEHLISAGFPLAVDGIFGPLTQAAVAGFQTRHRIRRSGVITAATWSALLRYPPVAVRWSSRHGSTTAVVDPPGHAGPGGSRSGSRQAVPVLPVPASAHMRARRDELRGNPGEGYPEPGERAPQS